jgi:hypothetical protein
MSMIATSSNREFRHACCNFQELFPMSCVPACLSSLPQNSRGKKPGRPSRKYSRNVIRTCLDLVYAHEGDERYSIG